LADGCVGIRGSGCRRLLRRRGFTRTKAGKHATFPTTLSGQPFELI
jgi:hypothetical protein